MWRRSTTTRVRSSRGPSSSPTRSRRRREVGELESSGGSSLLHLLAGRLEHLHAGIALAVPLDEVPRRGLVVGASEHVFDRQLIGPSLLAVAPVLVGEL